MTGDGKLWLRINKPELGRIIQVKYQKKSKYYMTELRQINKQEFLQELKYRIEREEITEEEIVILMRSYLLKKEEEWKKGYELAAKDKEREKEAKVWENLEDDEWTDN